MCCQDSQIGQGVKAGMIVESHGSSRHAGREVQDLVLMKLGVGKGCMGARAKSSVRRPALHSTATKGGIQSIGTGQLHKGKDVNINLEGLAEASSHPKLGRTYARQPRCWKKSELMPSRWC